VPSTRNNVRHRACGETLTMCPVANRTTNNPSPAPPALPKPQRSVKWKQSHRNISNLWCLTPDGRTLVLFRSKFGNGWCFLIADCDGPHFYKQTFRTRDEAGRAALIAAGVW
jgi:hypothetical protein